MRTSSRNGRTRYRVLRETPQRPMMGHVLGRPSLGKLCADRPLAVLVPSPPPPPLQHLVADDFVGASAQERFEAIERLMTEVVGKHQQAPAIAAARLRHATAEAAGVSGAIGVDRSGPPSHRPLGLGKASSIARLRNPAICASRSGGAAATTQPSSHSPSRRSTRLCRGAREEAALHDSLWLKQHFQALSRRVCAGRPIVP